jgi:3-carboxy-cis,cis-muconate cycloisomerase
MSGLFDAVLARGPAREATADEAWLQAMLDAEAALAWALADTGRTGPDAARAVAEQCRAERFAVDALGAAAAAGGIPVIPMVDALRAAVGPSRPPRAPAPPARTWFWPLAALSTPSS